MRHLECQLAKVGREPGHLPFSAELNEQTVGFYFGCFRQVRQQASVRIMIRKLHTLFHSQEPRQKGVLSLLVNQSCSVAQAGDIDQGH